MSYFKITIAIAISMIFCCGIHADRTVSSGKWAEAWLKAKKKYEKTTGEKKPDKKSGVFGKHSTGLYKAAKDADKQYGKIDKKRGLKVIKQQNKFLKSSKKFRKEIIPYVKDLKELKKEEENSKKKKGLAVLISYLEAIEATLEKCENDIKINRKELEEDEKWRRVARVGIKAAVKKMKSFIANVNKDDDIRKKIATYNKYYHNHSRDLGMSLRTSAKKDYSLNEVDQEMLISLDESILEGGWGISNGATIEIEEDATDEELEELFDSIFSPLVDIYKETSAFLKRM
ncbi:hypothetical protein [Candidatus Uabimicrobium sp. HlEnr_7]|uniref:hypothetical protein n=1 Tax=Candidatus Uabimicrobium helgolandensis TaxID=3095367 RepID=UPI003557D045